MQRFIMLLFIASLGNTISAQYSLPYTFINNSTYTDSEIYIGLVGKFGDNQDVWMDMTDYQLIEMSADQNTIDGPTWSTPSTWKYPEIFTKLVLFCFLRRCELRLACLSRTSQERFPCHVLALHRTQGSALLTALICSLLHPARWWNRAKL